jgi:hypothetical protein
VWRQETSRWARPPRSWQGERKRQVLPLHSLPDKIKSRSKKRAPQRNVARDNKTGLRALPTRPNRHPRRRRVAGKKAAASRRPTRSTVLTAVKRIEREREREPILLPANRVYSQRAIRYRQVRRPEPRNPISAGASFFILRPAADYPLISIDRGLRKTSDA